MDCKARIDLHLRRSRITRRSVSTETMEFFNVLTRAGLREAPEALLPVHRERLYPPTTTMSMFMRQTLEAALRVGRRSMAGQGSEPPMTFELAGFAPTGIAERVWG